MGSQEGDVIEKGAETAQGPTNVSVSEQEVEKVYHHKLDADEALDFFRSHGITTVSPEDDKRILRKIDMFLMPLMLVTNTLNFLDKNALSNSVNFGLKEDNHLVGNQYSWASGSVFYLTYMVCQPLVSRSLQWFPVGKLLSVSVVAWGAVLMLTACTRSFAALMSVRAVLGAFESVINPTLMLMTAQWYKRSEQPERVGWWFMGNALGQIFGGIIGYGVGNINANLEVGNWIWYFIIFGGFTILYGVFLYFIIPDSPMTARWLSDRDRALALARVRQNRTGIMNRHLKWYQVKEALLDFQTWMLVIIQFLTNVPSGGVASFGTQVIKGFGFSALNTTLLQMPLGLIQGITIILGGLACKYFKNCRWIVMIVTQIPALVGAILLYTLPSSHKNSRLASYYVIQTHSIVTIMEYSMVTANIAGTTKKMTVTALLFIFFCVAQVAAPQLFVSSESPRYPTAFKAAFSCFALLIILPIVLMLYLRWQNQKRDRQYGKVDHDDSTDISAVNGDDQPDEFFDLTDFEQKEKFRYVY
ncbi:major facilitator superfamily transporter allantoate [Hypoxylon trugodes]|uniref:major facilitator superfamily transporter allantoate n=1 Tax=Hypoxylon trugodes TaxID=326681 RepID=UPI00218F9BCC|nr:major facilitator superfamily transporter allantoate [Hypoxylon trugodes]KAI1385490.1 major facilitator superfamily transporter allantoate [Hypoxylon trugodes]